MRDRVEPAKHVGGGFGAALIQYSTALQHDQHVSDFRGKDLRHMVGLTLRPQPDTSRIRGGLARDDPGDRNGCIEYERHYRRPSAIRSAIVNRPFTFSFLRNASASSSTAERSHADSFTGTTLATTRPRLVITVDRPDCARSISAEKCALAS